MRVHARVTMLVEVRDSQNRPGELLPCFGYPTHALVNGATYISKYRFPWLNRLSVQVQRGVETNSFLYTPQGPTSVKDHARAVWDFLSGGSGADGAPNHSPFQQESPLPDGNGQPAAERYGSAAVSSNSKFNQHLISNSSRPKVIPINAQF